MPDRGSLFIEGHLHLENLTAFRCRWGRHRTRGSFFAVAAGGDGDGASDVVVVRVLAPIGDRNNRLIRLPYFGLKPCCWAIAVKLEKLPTKSATVTLVTPACWNFKTACSRSLGLAIAGDGQPTSFPLNPVKGAPSCHRKALTPPG